MRRLVPLLALALLAGPAPAASPPSAPSPGAPSPGAPSPAAPLTGAQAEAQRFLDLYTSVYLSLYKVDSEMSWKASTDVSDGSAGGRAGASAMSAAFYGSPEIIRQTKAWLARESELTPLQVRQLKKILYNAGAAPGTLPEVVTARIEAESRAAAVQDAFVYCFGPRAADGTCPAPKSANDVDELLANSKNLDERLVAWTASKEIGRPLKPELVQLQKLRNQVAREMGYSSYFGYMVSDYGMTVPEMMALLDGFVKDVAPLYAQMSTWATRQLATRYGVAPPKGPVPAHWYTNRWAQEWGGLVAGADLDPYFAKDTPEGIVKRAERFYVGMGFDPLPPTFWTKSDLYPATNGRHKNSHASAWHMDLQDDVRSLMSVEANSQWFYTTNHELGHIYYYESYKRPEVPPLLREGANRAFHEAVGELISLAAGQVPYLQSEGILPPGVTIDPTQALLVDALERTVAFVPWSAGVMAHFEYELYEKDLPPSEWQRRWWEMVAQYQGVVPPGDRLADPALCDACTKTHIIDDPAGYYDYAIATVIKFQLHEHIATKILKEDPRSCNYAGNKEVGAFLEGVLAKGATEDWRKVLQDATGEGLSTRAMVAYFAPLETWLARENKKKR